MIDTFDCKYQHTTLPFVQNIEIKNDIYFYIIDYYRYYKIDIYIYL